MTRSERNLIKTIERLSAQLDGLERRLELVEDKAHDQVTPVRIEPYYPYQQIPAIDPMYRSIC